MLVDFQDKSFINRICICKHLTLQLCTYKVVLNRFEFFTIFKDCEVASKVSDVMNYLQTGFKNK